MADIIAHETQLEFEQATANDTSFMALLCTCTEEPTAKDFPARILSNNTRDMEYDVDPHHDLSPRTMALLTNPGLVDGYQQHTPSHADANSLRDQSRPKPRFFSSVLHIDG
jgi:hypothetical protein